MGSAINLKGNFFPYSFSAGPNEADIRALYADFGITGEDLNAALRNYEQQIKNAKVAEAGCVSQDS